MHFTDLKDILTLKKKKARSILKHLWTKFTFAVKGSKKWTSRRQQRQNKMGWMLAIVELSGGYIHDMSVVYYMTLSHLHVLVTFYYNNLKIKARSK